MTERKGRCTFCQMIRGEVPVNLINEGDKTLTIISLEGYPLVITRECIPSILDPRYDAATAMEFGLMEARISRLTAKVFNTTNIITLALNGSGAGQEVLHIHKHIIPIKQGSRMISIRRMPLLSQNSLKEISEKYKLILGE